MTWSRFDDAAAKHPKARLAGNEAWALWLAAVQYCNRYLTDGLVPLAALAVDCLPEPISMAKAKRLAEKLVSAKVRDDGAGLFEQLEPGKYAVHDFLDWNPSKVSVEAKRKTDRERKRGGLDSGSDSGATPPRIPSGSPDGNSAESRSDSASREGARVPAQPAVPAQPDKDPRRPKDLKPNARVKAGLDDDDFSDLPIGDRAARIAGDPEQAKVLRPHLWPEVVAVCRAFAVATGRERGVGSYDEDKGVRAVVALLNVFPLERVLDVLPQAVTSAWWLEKPERPLGQLSVEVLELAISDGAQQAHHEALVLHALEAARPPVKRADNAQAAADEVSVVPAGRAAARGAR